LPNTEKNSVSKKIDNAMSMGNRFLNGKKAKTLQTLNLPGSFTMARLDILQK
jgi:hypothetical protein